MTKLDQDARYFAQEALHFINASKRLLDRGASLPAFYHDTVPLIRAFADQVEQATQVKADAA